MAIIVTVPALRSQSSFPRFARSIHRPALCSVNPETRAHQMNATPKQLDPCVPMLEINPTFRKYARRQMEWDSQKKRNACGEHNEEMGRERKTSGKGGRVAYHTGSRTDAPMHNDALAQPHASNDDGNSLRTTSARAHTHEKRMTKRHGEGQLSELYRMPFVRLEISEEGKASVSVNDECHQEWKRRQEGSYEWLLARTSIAKRYRKRGTEDVTR